MIVIVAKGTYVSTCLLPDTLEGQAQHTGESPGTLPGDFGAVCSLCTCGGVMCGGVMVYTCA